MVQLAFGVSQTLTAIFLFPAILITAHWTLGRFIGLVLPTWPVVIVCLLHVPCRILFKVMRERWEAERAGAVRPPRIRGRWIGDLDLLSKLSETFKNGYFSDFLWEGADELGPLFDLHIFWTNNFLTCHPDHIKTILAGDFSNFEKGSIFRDTMYSVLGTGVFNSDGDMWKFHRGMTRPFFNRDRITHFDLFDHHAGEAIRRMKDRLQAGYAIDFQDVISRFTLDSATEFLFGSCVHSLASDLPYPHFVASSSPPEQASNPADDFAHAFFEVQEIIAGRTRQGFTWPFIEIFKDRTAEPMKVVNAYIDPILKEAVEKSKNGPEDKKNVTDVDENETLLDHLVKCTKDPVVLRDEILNIMIAGRDTTASSLTFAVYFLCMYPHVLQRLREEILDTVGPTRRPTSDDIRQMKYLRAVINETLRLYPPVPINVRYNTKATTWPNPLDPNGKPFYIPANSSCAYSVFMMHRRKEYWGPDAEEFDPDRFLDERLGKYLTPNPFIFLPFNAGPRICLGQQFAYNEMSFFLIRLLQNFSSMMLDPVAQPPDSRPPTEWAQAMGRRKAIERFFPKVHLTMYSKGGLWVKMIEATANSEAPKLD